MLKKVFMSGLVLVCILVGIFVYNKETYVGELVDPMTYFDEFSNNENNLVYEDVRVDLKEPVLIKDDKVYVRYAFANQYVNDEIFYDELEQVMTITNAREIIQLHEGENHITYGNQTGTYTLYTNDNGLYISANLLEDLFGVVITAGRDHTLFVATDESKPQQTAILKRKTSLRTHPQKKSTVVEKLKKGASVYVYEKADGFARVRSEDGIIGYIEEKDLAHEMTQEVKALPHVEAWPAQPLGQKVRLVWDQLTTQREVNWSKEKYQPVSKANVIAPTWFEFKNESGDLVDRATASYVQEAHQRGLEVWPILSHSFENGDLTAAILTSTAKRQHVIDQIIAFSRQYGFDGINIDIENIQTDTSGAWVQFMRELYPQLKAVGLKVSVDVYMPSSWSAHYEREKIARSCDYFIVMAYDQHWSGSEEAGSVSEIPWVEEGIQATIKEVPHEKLVLGMPFYTRLWLEDSTGLSTKSYGMASIHELISKWQVTPVLDEASGQNYVEAIRPEGTYKVWLEDAQSIAKRVAIIKKYELAGFGAWKLGLETSDIWNVLDEVK